MIQIDPNQINNNQFLNVTNTDQFVFRFQGGPQVEIRGTSGKKYLVEFYDNDTNELIFSDRISVNFFSKCYYEYYKNWRIVVKEDASGLVVQEHIFRPMSNTVIMFESSALGDTIAWIPYVEAFRKKWNVNVYCSTFHNQLFKEAYPNINWVNRGAAIPETRCVYHIGWFGKGEVNFRNPNDCRTIPLQQVASDILGLPATEIRPMMTKDKRAPLLNHPNYVVISTASTAQAKYWNLPNGWQMLVQFLINKGYQVVNVGREPNRLTGVIDMCGVKPIMDIVNIIQNCKFFIGLGSGLTWMAWALGKKSIMISGFSQDWCEFKEDNYRLINKNVCHGCFNDPSHYFDKGKWNWCPRNENTINQFICSKSISVAMVTEQIQAIEQDLNRVAIVN